MMLVCKSRSTSWKLVLLIVCTIRGSMSPSNSTTTQVFHIFLLNSSNEECHTSHINQAVQEAVDHLEFTNKFSPIFPDFRLELVEKECPQKCGEIDAQNLFLEEILQSNGTAIIGPSCPAASDALAQIASYYHVPMVSLATSSFLKRFNPLLCVSLLPSKAVLMDGVLNFLRTFPEWERVAIVSQDLELFREVSVYLETALNECNMTVYSNIISRSISLTDIKIEDILITQQLSHLTNKPNYTIHILQALSPYNTFSESTRSDCLKKFKTFSVNKCGKLNNFVHKFDRFDGPVVKPLTEVRIVILNMNTDHARALLKQAADYKHFQFVWIIPGLYEDLQCSSGRSIQGCTDNTFERVMLDQRVIVISPYPTSHTTNNLTGCSETQIYYRDFFNNSQFQNFKNMNMGRFEDGLLYQVYDAVFTIALGLNVTLATNESLLLQDINNEGGRRQAGSLLFENIAKTNFHGKSGHVCFKGGDRSLSSLKVLQYQESDQNNSVYLKEVGYISLSTGEMEFIGNITRETLWPAGIPSDGSPITEEKFPPLPVTIFSYSLSVINMILAVVCIIFTVIFRKKRLIRLSSPNLNILIAFGVIGFCIAPFFYTYPPLPKSVIERYCWIRSWFSAIGFTLCLGTINLKMWRVYYIFHNPKLISQKKPLKDWYLLLLVVAFVIIDVAVLIVATFVPQARDEAVRFPDAEHEDGSFNENGIKVNYEVTLCDSKYRLTWKVVLFGYKTVIQVIGLFLAFKIRKVKVKVLNDSKETKVILYITSIILAVVIVLTVAFSKRLGLYTAAYALGIPVVCTIILGVVFLSKAIQLWKDPEGENVFETVAEERGNTISTGTANCNDLNKVATLERRIKDLETQVSIFEEIQPSITLANRVCELGEDIPSGTGPCDLEFMPTKAQENQVQIVVTQT